MTKYGLIMNGKLLSFITNVSNNLSDDCNEPIFTLSEQGHNIWMTDSYLEAENVKNNPAKRYATSYNHPFHSFQPESLSIVEIYIAMYLDGEFISTKLICPEKI